MIKSEQLDELIALEIERRLGAEGTAVDPNGLGILLHSLRGSMAMAGHADLALVIVQLEQRSRQQESGINESSAEFLREVAARLRSGLPPLDTQWPVPPTLFVPSVVDPSHRAEYRATMLDRLIELDAVTTLQEPNREGVEQAYRLVHSMKSQAGSVGDDATAWYCHGLETRLRAALDDHQLSSELLAELARHSGTIARLVDNPEEALAMLRALRHDVPTRSNVVGSTVHPGSRSSSRPAPASWIDDLGGETEVLLRVPSSTVERLFDHLEHIDVCAEELSGAANLANVLSRRLRALDREILDVRRAIQPANSARMESSISYRLERGASDLHEQAVELTRLASVCDKNSELLRSQWTDTRRALSQLRRTTLSWLFERVASAVQRFAQGEGKDVKVHGTGGDISLDRSLAERLLEPVMQVIRNAISHGIDAPEARIAAGKPPQGKITMQARRQGDWLCLTVDDDGRGLDVQRVRQLAIERGVASDDTVRHLGQRELFNLLFLPGFSTRSGPDVLAGRGVGLDLARDIMRRLGGTLRLSGIPTGGMRATLELPIERGLVDVVWLKSSGQQFALPVTYTGRVLQRDPNKPAPTLAACLGLQAQLQNEIELEINVPGVQPIAVGIDALDEVEEVVVRPMPPLLSQLGPYSGAVLRGDGSLRLVLDAAVISGELWSRYRT